MRVATLGLATGIAALALGPAAVSGAQGNGAWLHVHVEEAAKPSKVSVNLPISVVQAALQAAPERVLSGGRIRLGHENDISVAQLRKAWSELRSAGDAEFVTVEERGEKTRIARAGNLVLVHIEKPAGREVVRVEVPVEVVDALFSGEGNELNVREAFLRLQSRRGDIVRVNDERSTVRIWIDERSQP